MKEQESILRGNEAQQVFDNEAYKMGMSLLKDAISAQWKECPIRDTEGQVLLLQLAKLADKFESILHGFVENGKFEQRKLELNALRNESKPRQFLRKVVSG